VFQIEKKNILLGWIEEPKSREE